MTLLCFIPLRLPSFLEINEPTQSKRWFNKLNQAFIGHRSTNFRLRSSDFGPKEQRKSVD